MNPKTKIYHNGKEINWRNQHGKISWFTRFQRWTVKWTKRVMMITALIGSGYVVAYTRISKADIEYVDREVIKEVQVMHAPVLDRIAKCESGGVHKRNGQVIFNANTNGSVDIGLYQINSIWNSTATKMGLDLTLESDNKKFAEYLYTTKGTEPWYSSKSCWNK
jgi:hypothetical protein